MTATASPDGVTDGAEEPDSWQALAEKALRTLLQATEYDDIYQELDARRDALLAAEDEQPARPEVCTGVTATWCPIHGDCTCDRREGDGDVDFDSDTSCPLHGSRSGHAEPAAPVDEHPPTFHVRQGRDRLWKTTYALAGGRVVEEEA